MRIEDKMNNRRKQAITICLGGSLTFLLMATIYYFLTKDIIVLILGLPIVTIWIVFTLYIELVGRKNFLLTDELILLSNRSAGQLIGRPISAYQLRMTKVTNCVVYNNMILVGGDVILYPIRKEELDDFGRVRDALISYLKSKKIPVKIYNKDRVDVTI
jgi:hypothetical protein